MSNWDDRSGWRPDRVCPECRQNKIWYTGDVDTTQWGDENRSRARGMYVCKNEECSSYEQQVKPSPR